MKREMSVSGSFYPTQTKELERYFNYFNTLSNLKDIESKIVIVPHAGYIYSGYTANLAYKVLQKSNIKKFIVIGPSHKVSFDGVSICNFKKYRTPFGDIEGDSTLVQKLSKNFEINSLEKVHVEHSTEVQFPFIKHYMPDVKIVELVYGKVEASFLSRIIDFVLKDEEYGVIISTDLSHFYNLQNANELDNICIEAIKTLNTQELYNGCEACGIIGIEAILLSVKKLSLNSYILDYRTSADASEDSNSVVGYMSSYFA